VRISGLERAPGSPVKDPIFEIVGVTSDARNQGIRESALPEILIPYPITGAFDRAIMVRTAGPPAAMIESVRREVWAVDRGITLGYTASLEGWMKQVIYGGARFGMVVMTVLAAVGLVLVAIDVFSLIAYTVSRRTHEIGIRMALGAGGNHVLRMVLSTGAQLVSLGILIGLLASLALARIIEHQIWGISLRDPVTFAAVIAVVVVVGGFAACYIPARRAIRVDPLVALRNE
jgi:putative ABC transport system permease protein